MTTQDSRTRPNIPCVVLAGGQSRRFGANKALAVLNGRRLIDIVTDRLARQTEGAIAINTSARDIQLAVDLEIVPDCLSDGLGPLAGIHAAMRWAHDNGFGQVITTPVDTPIIPANFVSELLRSGAPSVAKSADRIHAVHGLWPVALRHDLAKCIDDGMRAAQAWSEEARAAHCAFAPNDDVDPFFNVNTQDDLRTLSDAQAASPR